MTSNPGGLLARVPTSRHEPWHGTGRWQAPRDPAMELWEGLVRAAQGMPSSPVARAALSLSADGGRPQLGWVTPVPWPQVEDRLADPGVPLPGDGGLLVAATGGWAFSSRAIAECAAPPARLLVADTLDAGQVARMLVTVGGWPVPSVLAISASGQTLETRLLTETIAIACRAGGTARVLSEATVPGGLSLPRGSAVNALFGAPLSVPFAVVCAATGLARFRCAYEWFCAASGSAGAAAAALAWTVPACLTPRLHLVLPRAVGDGARLWALQVLRQGLAGGPGRQIWCDVSVEGTVEAGFQPDPTALTIRITDVLPAMPAPSGGCHDEAASAAPLALAMITMYAVAVLTACLGIRCGVNFTSHPAVARYKAFLEPRPGGPAAACQEVRAGENGIVAAAARWLASQPGLSSAHLVRYDCDPPGICAAQLSEMTGRRWEVHSGSRWNHHSYQAVHGDPGVGVVAVTGGSVPARYSGDPRLDRALGALAGHQAAIARATCASLAPRALLITR